MAGSLKNIGLTSLDDLFKTDEQRQADAQERVQIVPADQVFPYARQPYSIDRPTQDLAQLMDSIERVGNVYTAVFTANGVASSAENADTTADSSADFNYALLLIPLGILALGGVGYGGYKGYKHYQNKKRGYE